MRTSLRLMLALGILSVGTIGFAEEKIRQIQYASNKVFPISVKRGYATHIVLDPKEKITDWVAGDTSASGWQFSPQMKGSNHIFLKPGSAATETNLEIVTDKRNYSFDLYVLKEDVKAPGVRRYVMDFGDLDSADSPDGRLNRVERLIKTSQPEVQNWNYSLQAEQGSDDIYPAAVWDDGRFTYFRIPNNREIPAFFKIDSKGNETLVNTHSEKDLIVVREVARRFVLRLSNQVVGVWNDAYDRDGRPPQDGTTVPGVKRTVEGQS